MAIIVQTANTLTLILIEQYGRQGVFHVVEQLFNAENLTLVGLHFAWTIYHLSLGGLRCIYCSSYYHHTFPDCLVELLWATDNLMNTIVVSLINLEHLLHLFTV